MDSESISWLHWDMPNRRQFLFASAAALVAGRRVFAERSMPVITVYKSPDCECCNRWVKHLSAAGFVVMPQNVPNIDEIKRNMRVPVKLQSCHTAVVDRYLIEGHVPAASIKKLLAEKPAIQGLAVPGMPVGTPGMEGDHVDHYDVIAFTTAGQTSVFARH
jgi:hypothetical protein